MDKEAAKKEIKTIEERLLVFEERLLVLKNIVEAPQKVTDRVKTFSDACRELGINPTQITNNTLDTKDEIAYKKLKIIVRALNEGWKPDYNNNNEYKYEPCFKMTRDGFSYAYYYYWHTDSSVGSLLVLKSAELAKYAGTQFLEEYKEHHNP